MADGVSASGSEEVAEPAPQALDAETLVQWFESAEQSTQDERTEAERDRDYYDSKQWTDTEIAELNRRKQPVITINRIKRKIDYLKGYENRTRTDPRAFPRTPKHENEAHAATDALRFVADQSRFAQAKSKVWEDVLVEGWGGALVGCRHKNDAVPEITIKRIPWDRLFRDPHSREQDFSDARYLGIVTWLDYDDAKRKWPEAETLLEAVFASEGIEQTYADRPKWKAWADTKRKRVRVVEMYYRHDGIWFQAFFTKGGLLKPSEPVKYLDQNGEPECPLILFGAYCNRDNERYGVVRELISSQDEINKRRSKALHLYTMRQVKVRRGSGIDPNVIRAEMAKPDGVIEYDGDSADFDILPTGDMARGQIELLVHATSEIDLAGPNSAMQGKDASAPSGRAILANQQGGAIEMEPLLDGLRDWQRRVMMQAWNRIRQYWTAETWVRVTDDEKNLKWVGLNQQVPVQGPNGQPMVDPYTGQPQTQVQNAVADLIVDITIEEAPDTANIQAEQFEQLTQMVSAGVPIPPDVIIELSALRNKDAILDRLKGNPEAAAQQQQMQQAKADAVFQANLEKVQSETAKNKASAVKTISDAAIAASSHTHPAPEMLPQGTPGEGMPLV